MRRTEPPAGNKTPRADLQLKVREDALQEACGADIPTWQGTLEQVNTFERQSLVSTPTSLHILVVEDNLVNQKVVCKQLSNEGNIVHVANHGQEALDFLRRSVFYKPVTGGEKLDIVLMDLEMPIMDGITCVKKIRELQTTGEIVGHIPIIAVTANARSDQIKECLEAGIVSTPYSSSQGHMTDLEG